MGQKGHGNSLGAAGVTPWPTTPSHRTGPQPVPPGHRGSVGTPDVPPELLGPGGFAGRFKLFLSLASKAPIFL